MKPLRNVILLAAISSSLLSAGCYRRPAFPPVTLSPQPGGGAGGPLQPRPLGRSPAGPTQPAPQPVFNPWQPQTAARSWKYIVIHHTATSRGSVASIHASHLKRKDAAGRAWQGIGYHFVIGNGNGMKDGATEATFRWRLQMQGAHAGVREYNEQGIGIVLVGNFEKTRPTAAQLASVKKLVAFLKQAYQIPARNVVAHKSIRATACPGRFFPMEEVSRAETEQHLGYLPARWEPLVTGKFDLVPRNRKLLP